MKEKAAPDAEVTHVHAEGGSVAVGGGLYGTVNINTPDAIEAALLSALQKHQAQGVSAAQIDIAREWQNELDKLIDSFKEKVESGQANTALGLLKDLLDRQASKLSSLQVFRIKANIAVCLYQLGRSSEAAVTLHEACSFAPDEPKAKANKVLAYMFDGKIDEAYQYSVEQLKLDPSNEWLAANGLQAARMCSDDEGIYDLIGEGVKQTESVQAAYLDGLAVKRIGNWLELAKEAHLKFPDNKTISGIVAAAELEAVVAEHNLNGKCKFPVSNPDSVNRAKEHLEKNWAEFRESEHSLGVMQEADACNLLLCYALVADTEHLKQFSIELLANYPENPRFAELAVQISLDFKLPDLFDKAISLLENEQERRRYTFVKNIHDRNWSELAKMQSYSIDRFDPEVRSAAKVAVFIAQAKQGQAHGKERLEKLISEEQLSGRGRYTLFELALGSNVSAIMQIAYEYGVSQITPENDLSEIISFCRIARSFSDWKIIVRLLKGIANPLESSEETRLLCLGYINDYPVREDAVHFFDRIIAGGLASIFLTLMVGLFGYKHHDFALAKAQLNSYLSKGGRDATAYLILSDICRLENDDNSLQELLNGYEAEELEGSPEQIMHVAKLLTLHGDAQKGLALGYKIFVENPKSAEIWLGYSHIFLFSGKRIDIQAIDDISAGVYFTLTSSEGVKIERLVEDDIDSQFLLAPDNVDQYVKKVYGLKTGDSFTQQKMQGDVTWTVTEIKHKFLRAFHYVLERYETEFPDSGGLWAVKIEKDNVQPMLDIIKKNSEHDENVISEFCEKHIPISAMAAIWEKNPIKIADMIRTYKGEIATCSGTLEERSQAYAIINDHAKNGIVLDTYTAWVASSPNIFIALKKSYQKIMVSRTTIIELMHLCDEIRASFGSELSISWLNGQFQKTISSQSEKEQLVNEISERIRSLEENFEVVQYDYPSTQDEITEQILENFGPNLLAPYFIALNGNAIFVSDDGYSREFAKGLLNLNSAVWLQTLLDVALSKSNINLVEYSECLFDLARYRHSHIALTVAALNTVYEQDNPDLLKFSIISRYIGVHNADIKSHFGLVKNFIGLRWILEVSNPDNSLVLEYLLRSHSREHPDHKAMKATSILIQNLIRVPGGVSLLNAIAQIPALRLSTYIEDWARGHFLPVSD
ncbi:tetratricopeptide repeat protein [Pseudomonas aeruginosa]|nr:hypothetical protein [Pseudomonas aeruginosa]HCF5874523.1 hypothetical protein [Pseudomonas aeruginosa]